MKKDKLIQELINLAGAAIHLAAEYAGGESETVEELTEELKKYEKIAYKMEDKK